MVALGCDRSPTPPKIAEKPAEPTAPTTPTTQELLTGPYKRITLLPLPFSARIPQSWETKTPEGTQLNFLQGPGPDGKEIQISLDVGTPLKPEQLKNVLEGARKAADRDKKMYRSFQIRKMGDMQVMDEQRIFPNSDHPDQPLIDWKLTFFVQRDLDYAPYVIDVLGLTEDRFEQSKELLAKIFDSIQYEPL
jgi:hypothetical protein